MSELMAVFTIPLPVMVAAPLLVVAVILVRWRVSGYRASSFVIPALLWLAFVVYCAIWRGSFGLTEGPTMRSLWVRPAVLLLVLAVGADQGIAAYVNYRARRGDR